LGRLGRFQITSLLGSKTPNIIGSIEAREIFLLFSNADFYKAFTRSIRAKLTYF
jgi:hypothetical protein